MKDRIKQIMEAQHMSQQVFAEFIGTTPATLSGIYNERTRPSINIVEAIKKKIPDISTDWLMFGIGEMYQTAADPYGGQAAGGDQRLAGGQQPTEQMIDFGPVGSPTLQTVVKQQAHPMVVVSTPQGTGRDDLKIFDKAKRHVTEIRVYYDDQTWESFVPSKK